MTPWDGSLHGRMCSPPTASPATSPLMPPQTRLRSCLALARLLLYVPSSCQTRPAPYWRVGRAARMAAVYRTDVAFHSTCAKLLPHPHTACQRTAARGVHCGDNAVADNSNAAIHRTYLAETMPPCHCRWWQAAHACYIPHTPGVPAWRDSTWCNAVQDRACVCLHAPRTAGRRRAHTFHTCLTTCAWFVNRTTTPRLFATRHSG